MLFPVQLWAGGERFHLKAYVVVRKLPTKEARVTAGFRVTLEGVQNQENFLGEVSPHGNLGDHGRASFRNETAQYLLTQQGLHF